MVFTIAALYGFKPSNFNIFTVFESNGEDIGSPDNRFTNFISNSRIIKEVAKEIVSEVIESELKKTSVKKLVNSLNGFLVLELLLEDLYLL